MADLRDEPEALRRRPTILWGIGLLFAALTAFMIYIWFYQPEFAVQMRPALSIVYWVVFAALILYIILFLYRKRRS